MSLRFGPSETTCRVLLPDGQTILLTGNNIFRKKEAVPIENIKSSPQSALLGEVTFAKWDGKNPYYSVDAKFQAWINPVGIIVTSPYGKALETGSQNSKLAAAVDVNVSRGGNKAGLKLYHISMCDNALSISLWFKTD